MLYPYVYLSSNAPPHLRGPDATTMLKPPPAVSASCPKLKTVVPGTELSAFRDHGHINTVGSIYMWPHICDAMESIGLM